MKRTATAIILILVMTSAASVSAQSIGIFPDTIDTYCNLAAPIGVPVTAYITVIPGGPLLDGIQGAEFQIVGLPSGLYIVLTAPSPLAHVVVGDPFNGGCNIAFPTCQAGPGPVLLYTATLINLNDTVGDRTLTVTQHTSPSSPNFLCPKLNECNPPLFTTYCVPGGELILNNTFHCLCCIAVESATWGEVKSLYGG